MTEIKIMKNGGKYLWIDKPKNSRAFHRNTRTQIMKI